MNEILQNKKQIITKLKLILEISYSECKSTNKETADKFIKINEEAFKCLKMLS